jgi:O-antigen ligase/polysaccharide polymerase Wzy-like membrane protein
MIVSVLLALLLGVTLAHSMKMALAEVVLLLGVFVPLLVIGTRPKPTVLLLIAILYLAPEIAIAADLPRIVGDEVVLYITGLLMLVERLGTGDAEPALPMPAVGIALLLFLPLTALTIANGAARFGINPSRRDYFEFIKFGKYVVALYIASTVRVDRRFLRRFSWAVAIGGFVASAAALLQAFNFLGARSFFELVYYSANEDKVGENLEWRASGTIGNPNELALFVVAGLAFAVMLIYRTKPRDQRWVLAGFVLADAIAVVLSGSRMGLLAAALVVFLVVVRSGRAMTGMVLTACAIFAVAFLVVLAGDETAGAVPAFVSGALHPLVNRAERFDPRHLSGIVFRFAMWRAAWAETQSSLLLGYGPAKGATSLRTSQTTDSEIFMVALRYGLIGLSVWIGVWVTFLRTARKASKALDPEARAVGRVLWAVLIVNLLASSVNYTFLAVRRMTLVCIVVGLSAAIVRSDKVMRRGGA